MTSSSDPTRFAHARTTRLRLDMPEATDVQALYDIHSDVRTWGYRPESAYDSIARAERLVADSRRRFETDGLSYWCVRADGDDLIGWGGCSIPRRLPWWNLTYRLTPGAWGLGYATEIAEAAIEAAHAIAPEVPVLAFTVDENPGSIRVIEKLGLTLHWRGPDRAHEGFTRRVYLDTDAPSDEVLAAISSRMMPATR